MGGRLRHAPLLAALLAMQAAIAPAAAADDSTGVILTTMPMARVTGGRWLCASGVRGSMIANMEQAFGTGASFRLADECIAYLTRLGREGALGYVRDAKSDKLTPALALDRGFVTAYLRHPELPADAPSMVALAPGAETLLHAARGGH